MGGVAHIRIDRTSDHEAERSEAMKRSLVTGTALAVTVAALAASTAWSATPPRYDGYKSSYPQLHQLTLVAGVPDPDLKSSYPQAHEVLSGAVAAPSVVAAEASGIDWRDAGFGALAGAAAVALLAVAAALLVRRHRVPALR
jgi:hypothetical protein